SSNDEDGGKGFIVIENGTISIECGNDGIQAATELIILNGDIKVIAGGGTQDIVVDADMNEQLKDSMPVIEETESTKGLKSTYLLVINGGSINIDSHDDALHSDNIIEINNGVMILSTDDDGIHGDNEITINGGYIDITNCNEGIEAKIITVNDGEIYINASDDGFNASDGIAGSMGMMMRPGNETAAIGIGLYINGGYIVIRSNADSVDSNADFIMTGGMIIAQGPESSTNGALDANGEIFIEGGLLIAVGSSGMAEYPGPNSDQISFLYVYDTVQQPGTTIAVESEDGEIVLVFTPDKVYQTLVFSSADLEIGKTYTIYSGGNAEGESTDGLYREGSYKGGTLVAEITLQSTVTVVGTQSRMDGPGGGGMRPGKRP
ncbi:MAG: carbohydrate-binding domain-containing protein, partial [Clostridia bacterium]|nr:carbohydrate-binding domain-containing protein [Clostridia bacterium]